MATIAEAEATRDADVKAAAANLEGETAKARSDEEISNAIRQRDETKAKNDAAVQAEQARIAVRGQTAEAEESRKLKVAQVEAEEAEVQARTRLQAEEKKAYGRAAPGDRYRDGRAREGSEDHHGASRPGGCGHDR